jgi:hypothetical protein
MLPKLQLHLLDVEPLAMQVWDLASVVQPTEQAASVQDVTEMSLLDVQVARW